MDGVEYNRSRLDTPKEIFDILFVDVADVDGAVGLLVWGEGFDEGVGVGSHVGVAGKANDSGTGGKVMAVELAVVAGPVMFLADPAGPGDGGFGFGDARGWKTLIQGFQIGVFFQGEKIIPIDLKTLLPRAVAESEFSAGDFR